MEPEAAELPDDLLLRGVFARLAVDDLARCRCVCRRWNNAIISPAFKATINVAHAAGNQPWLFVFDNYSGRWCAYCPDSACWRLPSLPGPPADWCGPSPLAAAGSLLIYTNAANSELYAAVPPAHVASTALRLAVCNPVTGAWKELPPPTFPHRHMPFVGAIELVPSPTDLHLAHFKVVLAGGFHPHRGYSLVCSTEIYDSASDSWTMPTEMTPEALTPSSQHGDVVCCDGIMYCLDAPGSIMAFDLESCVWRKDQVYDVKRGLWDRLKWRVEGHARSLSLAKSTNAISGRGLLLTAAGALNSPHVCLSRLPFGDISAPDSSLVRWAEDMMPQPPHPPLNTNKIDFCLASAHTFYIAQTFYSADQQKLKLQVLSWDYTHFPLAPEWTLLPPCPLRLESKPTVFLVDPS